MRLENQQATSVWRVAGLLLCLLAVGISIVTGGVALVPAMLLLALGAYYAGRTQVEAIVLSEYLRTVSVTRSHGFTSSVRTFPVQELTARYQAHGGLRSGKYYTLELHYQGNLVAVLDPKAGYYSREIELLYSAMLALHAAGQETKARS